MASPFRNSKKERRRLRNWAKRLTERAERREAAGNRPAWCAETLRWLAASNLKLAQGKRRKRANPPITGYPAPAVGPTRVASMRGFTPRPR
jgi:hypothetical protein